MKIFIALLIAVIFSIEAPAQTDTVTLYQKKSFMIPMRDGIKLYTVVLSAVNPKKPVPVLITRTPYGAGFRIPDDTTFTITSSNFLNYLLAWGGYIFVYQDIRGKYKSEGTMQIHQPLIHASQKEAVDESTDTWDTVDWLIKNISNNNGMAGIFGVSYPGWLALVGLR